MSGGLWFAIRALLWPALLWAYLHHAVERNPLAVVDVICLAIIGVSLAADARSYVLRRAAYRTQRRRDA